MTVIKDIGAGADGKTAEDDAVGPADIVILLDVVLAFQAEMSTAAKLTDRAEALGRQLLAVMKLTYGLGLSRVNWPMIAMLAALRDRKRLGQLPSWLVPPDPRPGHALHTTMQASHAVVVAALRRIKVATGGTYAEAAEQVASVAPPRDPMADPQAVLRLHSRAEGYVAAADLAEIGRLLEYLPPEEVLEFLRYELATA